jgi:hypothetical protein
MVVYRYSLQRYISIWDIPHPMTPIDIILSRLDDDGTGVPIDLLAEYILGRIESGQDLVLEISGVVFTVSTEPECPTVHMFSIGVGSSLLPIGRRFMREVWSIIDHPWLIAPVKKRGLVRVMIRKLGWQWSGVVTSTGHYILLARRPWQA